MGIMQRYWNRRYGPAKQDLTEASPKYGFKRFWFVLTQNFWRLVGLNLLFLVFCLPVVTIPAAVCGMNRVLINFTREGHAVLWTDFFKEFKANLLKSLPFGLLTAFLLFDSLCAFYFGRIYEEYTTLLGALGVFLLMVNMLFSAYVFVFLPSLDLRNRHIAKNSLILMLSEWKADLVLIAVMAVSGFLSVAFFPFSIIVLVFFMFSFTQLAVCVCVNGPMQRRIVGPYEESTQ